jgi:hypothetical protein
MPGISPEEWEGVVPEEEELAPIPVAPGQVGMLPEVVEPVQYEATIGHTSDPDVMAELAALKVLAEQAVRGLISVANKTERILNIIDRPAIAQTAAPTTDSWQLNAPPAYQAGAPIQGGPPAGASWVCPVHNQVKTVPAGFSQRTQKPYPAFLACPVQGCQQKPPR